MFKLSTKIQNPMLAFNSALFLNNRESIEQILRDSGLENLAELAR
jgi:hypothetical protein